MNVRKGQTVIVDGNKLVVGAPCSIKDVGHWYCVTCGEHFRNNFEKDTHLSEHEEVPPQLAWICHEHGVEQP